MGESIELTTWPNQQNIFYKVTSSTMSFEVKAPGNASIGLATKPGRTCDLQIALGHNRRSWIKIIEPTVVKETVETPDILSPDEYRRFWIKWYGDYVLVGRGGEINPIMIYNCQMPNLKYVTFSVLEDRNMNPVHWRFEVPPSIEEPILKPIQGGDLHWVQVDSDNRFPDDAIIGGFEKENLYIIRALHRESLTPGKFVSSEGVGYISWGGDAHEKDSFEVLCGIDCTWVPASRGKIPAGAVEAGHSENFQREKLYIGRVNHMGHLIPGKVQPLHRVCYISYDGKEIAKDEYEILVQPSKMCHSKNVLLPRFELNLEDPYEDFEDNEVMHIRAGL